MRKIVSASAQNILIEIFWRRFRVQKTEKTCTALHEMQRGAIT
jgi:hypothetical protein